MIDRRILTLLFLVVSFTLRAESLSLDGEWMLLRSAQGERPAPGAAWEKVVTPHLVGHVPDKPFLWYRKNVGIPVGWSGRHLFLHFEGVKFVTEVYVDGNRVGGHAGGFEPWEVDLGNACAAGREHELLLRVQDITGLIEGELDLTKLKPGMRFVSLAKNSLMAPVGSQYTRFGLWQGASLLARADVYIEDVFIRPSVRKGTLAAEVTLRNLGARSREVSLAVGVEGGPSFETQTVTIPAGGSQTVGLSRPWEKPRLWTPEDPHLYRLSTAAHSDGVCLEKTETRFGFREFWTDGPDLVLNGTPMKFLATAGHPRGGVDPAVARDEALDLYKRIRQAGCVAMRLHANIWPRQWYEVADEIGMPLIFESALFCWSDSYALDNDAFWKNYNDHLRATVRSHRNHPSIVMTSLENEILHCRGDRVAQTEHRLAEAGRMVKALDPTRPIMYDADADPEGVADVVNLHYPIDFNRDNLWPNAGFWLESGMEVAGWPRKFWSWDRKKPLYFGEFLHLQHFNEADPYSALLGDDAYVGHAQAMARCKALAWEMQIEAYRACDVSGMVPWTLTETGTFPADDNPRYLAVKRAYEKNAAFIREHDSRFYAGEDVERTVYLYNDTWKPATLRCAWRLTRGETVDAEGERTEQLGPARKAVFPIRLRMPKVAARSGATLTIQVHNDRRLVFERATHYDIMPRRSMALSPGLRLAVFGQISGELASLLEQAGVRPVTAGQFEHLPECDALLIAPHALDAIPRSEATLIAGRSGPREALAEFVAKGGTVIAMEQGSYDCGVLPGTLEDRACTVAFRRSRDVELMAGLEENDFRFWRGDHVVARRTIRKPTSGRFRALVDSGGKEGLVHLPWLEIDHGLGRYLLCQLALGEKLDREPAAQIVLENMLRSAGAKRPAPGITGVVQDKLKLVESLAEINARHENLSGRLAAADLGHLRLLLLETDSQEVADNVAKIAGFVRAGGRVILHGGTPEGLARLAALLPERMALQPSTTLPVNLADWDPVIDGLTNQELYWHASRSGLYHRTATPLSSDVCKYVVVPGLPETPHWTTVAAGGMEVIHGQPRMQEDVAHLSRAATLECQVDIPAAGPYALALRLRGTSLGGIFPQVSVSVGDQKCGIISAPGKDWGVAWCTAVMKAGSQTVRLSFINDQYDPVTKEDRNVVIGEFMLTPVKPLESICLTRPNALVKATVGKGCVLIDQVRWDEGCASSLASSRYLSNLLTNMGADFGAAGAVVAAERFKFDRESPAFRMRDGRAYLGATGGMTCRLRFARTGRYEFRIRASGTEVDDVFPNIALQIDGRPAGNVSLHRAGWQTVVLTAEVSEGEHAIGLAFTNDFYRPPKDRNLTIESLDIQPSR